MNENQRIEWSKKEVGGISDLLKLLEKNLSNASSYWFDEEYGADVDLDDILIIISTLQLSQFLSDSLISILKRKIKIVNTSDS